MHIYSPNHQQTQLCVNNNALFIKAFNIMYPCYNKFPSVSEGYILMLPIEISFLFSHASHPTYFKMQADIYIKAFALYICICPCIEILCLLAGQYVIFY